MHRRTFLATATATSFAPLAGCAGRDGGDGGNGENGGIGGNDGNGEVLADSFESALEGWNRHAHVGPEVTVEDFEWAIDRTDERAHGGEWSLRVFTEGDHDDGTAWVSRKVELPEADRYTVEVWAWSESESFNELRHLVAALAPEAPAAEEDFPEPGENSTGTDGAPAGGLREPLHRAEGWERYRFAWTPEEVPSVAHLAVGVSVVWESDVTHFVDDVRVLAE